MISNSNSNIQNSVKIIFEKHISRSKTEEQIVEMMLELFDYSEKEVKDCVTDEERSHMDCKAGCSVCCRVNVSVLSPEAAIIKNYLINNLPPEELSKLKEKMKKLVTEIKYLDEDERIFLNVGCAFLDESGACSIYPVRPLLCRSVTSADSGACKTAMSMMALGESVFVPMNISQKSILDTVFKSLADEMYLAEIPNKSSEMTAQVLKILET